MGNKATKRYKGLPDLIHYPDDKPGWSRKPKKSGGFNYYKEDGERITDKLIHDRLETLAIPPAWTEVWICPKEKGHLLSTGRDDAGRKQYRYHPDWMAFKQLNKFSKLLEFAEELPAARVTIRNILTDNSNGWHRERVVALSLALMDETGMRVGNAAYQRRNGTTGLTTLRRKHMTTDSDGLHFEYVGKSGIDREVDLHDPVLTQLISDVSELPGYEVFRYRDKGGSMTNVDSGDVNDLVHELLGDRFSSKYFRTWAATSAAVYFYWEIQSESGDAELPERMDLRVVERVADYLGNTVNVCRKYYIHPSVLAAVTNHEIPPADSITKKEEKTFMGEFDAEEIIARRVCSVK
ncbi:DNA topoisomerase IB [Neolewinella antarctica]|uniref:DNA topoisomerase n=1 Tax=Neolewinella antarctica TaxID=442734 RepID=A0ABX0XBW4_9BACT|nr:DNA topoisomerase IB [Neolewinella antarctica]NJC26267.1 DNA topoisomerase-1 [Neolewinella antarctica]